ncbi:MAG: translation initiation factor IF-2 [Lachnospiraceae bacterium]|nr:translation initiation factor IF-2 [Lachnospiraceae bacterium]
MAKLKIKELADEIGINSKDIIQFLNDNGIEAKSSTKGLEDEQIEMVRNKFSSASSNKAESNSENKASLDTKSEEGAEDKPKKKKNISVVVNTGNSRYNKNSNNRRRDDRNQRQNNDRRSSQGGNRPQRNENKPQTFSPIKPRPMSERTVRPQATRVQPEETMEKKENQTSAPKKEFTNNNNRPNDRKPSNNRGNDRGNDRNNNFNKDNRQNNRNNERSNDRSNDRNNDRNFSKDRNRNNNAPAMQENAKPKDANRDRDNSKKKHGTNRDHDALGKKQERYVNLEKNGGKKKQKYKKETPTRNEDEILTISLPERITIKELAEKMLVQPSEIVKKLFMKGQMVTVNQAVDYDQAEEIALEFNCVCEQEEKVDVIAELLKEDEEDPKDLVARPPVVCVMGHVDHGKTSLLDAIRDTRVTDREAGGITQKIGAYGVSINGQKITFLDTPGHEAFTAMRMRGASSTDIAILVVAADDGVMPQTVEAINHAKAAGIEIIVAINKIDKPNANVERVKQELSEYELIPSDWGGSTEFVPVSAHTHEGIDDLLETILLTAEILELKANPKRNARGLCVEAELDKGRGVVATVLVQKGTLHVGDPVAAGSSYGKVRAMIDEHGRNVKKAGPSTAVEILGLSEVPNAGEIFVAMDNEKEARTFAETFVAENKNKLIEETRSRMSLDDIFSQIQAGNLKELDLIVKADVQGSVEAVKQSLEKLSNDEVVVKVIHGGVGAINESDVILASASNAIIIGFNVRPDPSAKQTADHEGVDVRLYKVIYNAIEDVEAAMKGMLEPIYEEQVIGHAEIRQIFKASGVGNIAGSYVLDGKFQRDCKVRISREGEQIFEGALGSLKRFKDDVKEVKAGYECGLVFEGFDAIQEEDQVEAYIMVEVPRS